MKIIQKGRLPEEITTQFRCSNCNALIEAARKEGEFQNDQRDESYYKFICPECDENIYVDAKMFK